MKVRDLIRQLSQMPDDAEVIINNDNISNECIQRKTSHQLKSEFKQIYGMGWYETPVEDVIMHGDRVCISFTKDSVIIGAPYYYYLKWQEDVAMKQRAAMQDLVSKSENEYIQSELVKTIDSSSPECLKYYTDQIESIKTQTYNEEQSQSHT